MTIEKTKTLDTGTIVIAGPPHWNAPKNKLSETIRMDLAGRAQLIKALLSGEESIEVYGASGEFYSIYLRSIEGYPLD